MAELDNEEGNELGILIFEEITWFDKNVTGSREERMAKAELFLTNTEKLIKDVEDSIADNPLGSRMAQSKLPQLYAKREAFGGILRGYGRTDI